MKILEIVQGSSEWLAARRNYCTASEASAMMGCHPTIKRSELLRMKATGDEKEYSQWVEEVLFARGHEVEALARPIAEKIIGEELYPCTATDDAGELLASFDGLTMDETICCEIKQLNKEKVAQVEAVIVPECDYWQCIQQLAVAEAEKCLYVVSDGTEEGTVHCWLDRDPDAEAKLRGSWAQFQRDLLTYEHRPEEAPKPIGRSPENLPALRIEVQGSVAASNLEAFEAHALSVIGDINTDLQTDADFADAEQTVKWLKKDVEERLVAAKEAALAQTEDIARLFRTIDKIADEARARRLELDKLVKHRKTAIRDEILSEARRAWSAFVDETNSGLGGKVRLPEIVPDFAGVMKGKRTVSSLRDAVDTEMAQNKIKAHALADRMRANLEILRAESKGYEALFSDAQALVQKDADDLRAQISLRIGEHKKAEADRLEAERAKIREEEQRKAQADADAKAPEERRQQEAKERTADEDARLAHESGATSLGEGTSEPTKPRPAPSRPAPSAEDLRESARRTRERADYAERSSDRNAERAEADRLDALAAAMEQAESRDRPLMVELGEWQKAHGISADAMEALVGILRDRTPLLDMAA